MLAQQNLRWLLLICAAMVLLQGWVFSGICMEDAQELHTALIDTNLNHIFLFCFLALTVRLCLTGCDRSGKSAYTYHRLHLSQREIYLIQAAFNALAYWFFFTVQLLAMLLFSAVYSCLRPQCINHMSLMQAAYRVPLFHLVLPLQDWINWAGNLVTLLGLSLCTAVFPLRSRYGKVSISAILMALVAVFYLYLQVYENNYFDVSGSVLSLFGSAVMIFCAVGGVWSTEADTYD